MATSTTDLPGALGAEYAGGDEHRPLAGYAVLTARSARRSAQRSWLPTETGASFPSASLPPTS